MHIYLPLLNFRWIQQMMIKLIPIMQMARLVVTLGFRTHVGNRCPICKHNFLALIDFYGSVHMHLTAIFVIRWPICNCNFSALIDFYGSVHMHPTEIRAIRWLIWGCNLRFFQSDGNLCWTYSKNSIGDAATPQLGGIRETPWSWYLNSYLGLTDDFF